jgi:hypothetical protein
MLREQQAKESYIPHNQSIVLGHVDTPKEQQQEGSSLDSFKPTPNRFSTVVDNKGLETLTKAIEKTEIRQYGHHSGSLSLGQSASNFNQKRTPILEIGTELDKPFLMLRLDTIEPTKKPEYTLSSNSED